MISAGQKLKEHRINKGLTLKQVSSETKIRQSFIEAIEKTQYDKLPSSAYASGFIKNYSEYLGAPTKEILALFRREFKEHLNYKLLPDSLSRKKAISGSRLKFRQSFFILAFIVLAILIYLGFSYSSMFIPPSLMVHSPLEGAKTKQEIAVKGKTDPGALIFINTEEVAISDDGSFSKKLNLFSGKNIITIKSQNRFGKETIIQRNITVEN